MPRPELAEGPVQAGEIGTRPGKVEEVALPETDQSRGQASPEKKPFQEVPEAMQQMVERFRLVRTGERHHLEMDLKPPHLGKLSVRITGTEDGVTARFEVGSVAAKSLVEYHIADLRQSLEASGVRLGSVIVDMGQGGQDPRGDHREKALGRRVFPVKTWEVPWDLEASPCSLNYLA
jgi:flagellar hook-length control protein FliK